MNRSAFDRPPESRIAAARSRAATAKQGLAVAAVGAFAAVLLLVRGEHAARSAPATEQAPQVADDTAGLDLGGGSIAPAPSDSGTPSQSFALPQAQTGVS